MATPSFPPEHLSGEFIGEAEAPFGYRGPAFTVEQALTLIRRINNHTVTLGESDVGATGTQVTSTHWKLMPSDPHHPLYFEVYGAKYSYTFSVYSNRLEIEVWRGRGPALHLSTMFPVTLAQLRLALATVAQDWNSTL